MFKYQCKENLMKNLFKWFGIISIALVIAFSFAACEDDSGGGGGGGGGTFTLTGIPSEYNGTYADFLGGTDETMVYATTYYSTKNKILVSGGKVSIPLVSWPKESDSRDTVSPYYGNDSGCDAFVMFFTTAEFGECVCVWGANNNSVTFRGGSATKSWNDGREIQ
jgi:hypothetical protein